MKVNNPEKYAHVVIGRWADVAEGAVFKKWGIVKEFPDFAKKVALASDQVIPMTLQPVFVVVLSTIGFMWMNYSMKQECLQMPLLKNSNRGD